ASSSARATISTSGTNALDLVLGTQGVNVDLNFTNLAWNLGTRIFSMNVTVQNLLTQPLGTTDGSTTTPTAVRVYFTYGPFASGGYGLVTVANPTGTAMFNGSTVPYFQYMPFI